MTTEQETGRGAPVRRAVPKTGTRRSGAPHQSKPRPRSDVEGKLSAAERARDGVEGRRPVAERARAEVDGKQPVAERTRADAGSGRPGAVRARPDAGGKRPGTGRGRTDTDGRRPASGRVRSGGGSSAAEELSSGAEARRSTRPVPRRRPARRQRAPFVLLVVGLLCGGLVSLLLLTIMLAQDAITDARLREEIAVARQDNEKINQNYQRNTQPDVIAELAENQGQHPDWGNVNSWSSANDRASQVDRER
ncbi:hypothetical protein ACFLIM_01570 [Nonomuraea sp. M3C6]|uniref:Cell division protein FtsL n=1 Tax=Nonomuraea marmarensis TaxID=3351344 RepID=A0ABW7A6G3_9ACTN